MATFTITNPAISGSVTAVTGTIVNFSGGSAAELQDLVGDTFVGGTAEDFFVTGNGNDTIAGQGGNDFIVGGGGADVLAGDDGNDTFSFGATDIPSAAEQIFGGSGVDSIRLQSAASVDFSLYNTSIDSIERVELGTGGVPNAATFNASAVGGGLASNLVVHNFTGIASFSDLTFRMKNVNFLNLSGFTFSGGPVNVETFGDDDADVINGGNGNDTLWGSWGADGRVDNMTGGNGADTYFVQETLDTVSETNTSTAPSELDTVYSAINMTLGANLENLFIYGSATLAIGNSLNNAVIGSYSGLQLSLNGMGGNDYIVGGGGNDTIDGNAGVDFLHGSGGADRFVFVAGEADGDVINDFDGAGAGALDNLRFLGYGADVTFTQVSPTQWMLLWDSGQFSETVTFNNAASIHASDYVFV